MKAKAEGGVKPPHSKALRAFSRAVVSRKIMKSALRMTANGLRMTGSKEEEFWRILR
jgi:hypothetical protein